MNSTYRLDGTLYAEIVRCGAAKLRGNAKTVNELNVFPVPDGDTGENMARTIEGGVAALNKAQETEIGKAASVLARGMLLAARGNSGVILSQFFEGIKRSVAGLSEVGVKALKAAFESGTKQSYAAVVRPTEGTILTVMREAGEKAKRVDDGATVEQYFEAYIAELKASLERTPELLPVLKESGVVDSGGAGFLFIMEGMYDALIGGGASANCAETGATRDADTSARFKIENKERKKYACVAVADGDGLIEQFKSLGADYVIDGKQTMNPSTQDFITAFDAVNAENIFVLPDNSNIVLAAGQAAALYKKSKVTVIPCDTIAQGYSALSMLDYSQGDADEIADALKAAAKSVTTGLVTYSIRDCVMNGRKIQKGDFLGFVDKTLSSCSKSITECAASLLDSVDKSDKSVIVAIRGKSGADDKTVAEIGEHIKKTAPDMEFYDFEGGQDVYSFIFVVE